MRKLTLLLMILLSNYHFCFSQTDKYDSLYLNGRYRTFMIHLPVGYNSINKFPLVLAFHGGAPLGYQTIQYQSGLTKKSDSASFILVYPEGVKIAGNRTFNAGGCCAPSTTFKIDDVGFVNSLLNYLFKTSSIDTTRVYATGFSNGSLLCYRLANQLASRFAAIAPVAGDLVYYPWSPIREVPIISFHSYKDQNVKYFGGVTVGTTGTYFPPQDSIFNIISKGYKCKILKDTIFHNPNKYDHFVYKDCYCNALLEQYVSYDGEHSWPGGYSTGVEVSKQFSATYLMWEFFKKYTIDCSKASNSNVYFENTIVFPNPVFDFVNISNLKKGLNYTISDLSGKVIKNGITLGTIDVSNLSPAVYILNLNFGDSLKIYKIIKN